MDESEERKIRHLLDLTVDRLAPSRKNGKRVRHVCRVDQGPDSVSYSQYVSVRGDQAEFLRQVAKLWRAQAGQASRTEIRNFTDLVDGQVEMQAGWSDDSDIVRLRIFSRGCR